MPGYILHLTAAKIYLNTIPQSDLLYTDPSLQNEFYIGNLLPDAVSDKSGSHFRDPAYRDYIIEWPRPEKFREKYIEHMDDPIFQGFYFHLCVDKFFFRDYLPQVVEFRGADGWTVEKRDEVDSVYIKKSGESVPLYRYLSEEYYYGDYTKMNTWLCRRYSLPENFALGRDPEIEEVRYRDVQGVLDELCGYSSVPAEAVNDLKVFDAEQLCSFLEHLNCNSPIANH